MRVKTIVVTCDQCQKEIREGSAHFQITYISSSYSTIRYPNSTEDYCSADCLVERAKHLEATGKICGLEHSVQALRCESCKGYGNIFEEPDSAGVSYGKKCLACSGSGKKLNPVSTPVSPSLEPA